MNKLLSVALALFIGLSSMSADAAKRMGSGKSFGKQSNNVTQNQAAKPAPNATPPAAAPAQPRRPWGAMLSGLAAGLGLAWLASSLGFGEELAQFMMFGLIALAIMVAVGYFMRRKAAANNGMARHNNLAFETAGAPSHASSQNTRFNPLQDQSRPLHSGSMIGSAVVGGSPATWSIPADFDVQSFVTQAKQNFVQMQDAWDRSDINSLRSLMTDDMLREIKNQIDDRDAAQAGSPVPKTEVLRLEAKLLGIEESGEDYMASIEFSGSIREEPGAQPEPFQEVWNLTLYKNSKSGWLVAGIQAI